MMKDEPEITLPHTRPLDSKTQSLMPKKSTPKKIVGTAGQTLPEEKDEGGRMKDEENEQSLDSPIPVPFESEILAGLTIELPLGSVCSSAYLSRHVDGHLDATQRMALRQIQNGLDAHGARLKNGRYVQSGIDAVRWVLEQFSNAATHWREVERHDDQTTH